MSDNSIAQACLRHCLADNDRRQPLFDFLPLVVVLYILAMGVLVLFLRLLIHMEVQHPIFPRSSILPVDLHRIPGVLEAAFNRPSAALHQGKKLSPGQFGRIDARSATLPFQGPLTLSSPEHGANKDWSSLRDLGSESCYRKQEDAKGVFLERG
jgi:hypothetical protein